MLLVYGRAEIVRGCVRTHNLVKTSGQTVVVCADAKVNDKDKDSADTKALDPCIRAIHVARGGVLVLDTTTYGQGVVVSADPGATLDIGVVCPHGYVSAHGARTRIRTILPRQAPGATGLCSVYAVGGLLDAPPLGEPFVLIRK